MKLSIETLNLLTFDLQCPEADKVHSTMVNDAFEHFVNNPKSNEKLYFNFRTVDGKIFMETETRHT